MGQLIRDLPNNYIPQVVTIQTLPRGRILTDSDGTNTTCIESTDAANKRVYTINATGAATKYFYTDVAGAESFKLLGFGITVDAAVTLSGTLEKYIDGDWLEMPAYSFPAGGGSYDATDAQKWNEVYPLEQGNFGTPLRIKAVVGGACNIKAQMLEG